MTERNIGALAGRVLAGQYELVKVIGDGGMGRVYRGVQLSTGGRVAIKVMDAWDHDATSLKRFRYEAETTAQLSHPNTVRILDFGSDDGIFFLVMEYLPGTDLTRYLRPEGQSDAFVAHVLLQVACSLAEAHSRGVIHRDIKPNNIMLLHHAGLPSFVKVIDFGIARAIDGPGHGTMGILGTMGYIAPEQMKDNVQPDARTDLYSLGCVAYEMLCGRLPFDGITHSSPPMDVLEAHLRSEPTTVLEAKPEVDEALAELIMSLIRKRPEARPPAAGELIEPLYGLRRRLSPELSYGFSSPSPVNGADSGHRMAVEPVIRPAADAPAIPGTAVYGSPDGVIDSSTRLPALHLDLDETPTIPGRVLTEDDEGVLSSAPPLTSLPRPVVKRPGARPVPPAIEGSAPTIQQAAKLSKPSALNAPVETDSRVSGQWGWGGRAVSKTPAQPPAVIAPSGRSIRDVALVVTGAAVLVGLAYLIGLTI